MQDDIFPRELSDKEKELLFSVLPENKPGYMVYREKINSLVVIGSGRFGGNNLMLGKPGSSPDLTSSSSPVFALGSIIYNNDEANIVIHEAVDDEVEIDISMNKSLYEEKKEIKRWNYSEWNPGDFAPLDNSIIREVEIIKDQFILAIAPFHKKIWLYAYDSQVNMLVPVTNFYNYLMMVKNIRTAELVFKPALLFSNLNTYSDEELKSAFIAYNKYFKRIHLPVIAQEKTAAKKKIKFNLFNRGSK